MNDIATLRAGADLIERVGLHKGEYWPGYGRRDYSSGDPACVLGALHVASGRPLPSLEAAVESLAGFAGIEWVSVWNDDPTTTAELVVKTMRACADELESA